MLIPRLRHEWSEVVDASRFFGRMTRINGGVMSRQQFGFLAGFLVVGLWAVAGFAAAAAAVLVGLAGFFIARVLDGEVNIGEIADRFTQANSSRRDGRSR